jgi:hypothetical protein
VFIAEEASIEKFYGVVTDLSTSKCFISRPYYKNGRYQLRNMAMFTEGNEIILTPEAHSTMKLCNYLKYLRERGGTREIWEFDTHQELFKWLSE